MVATLARSAKDAKESWIAVSQFAARPITHSVLCLARSKTRGCMPAAALREENLFWICQILAFRFQALAVSPSSSPCSF